MTERALVACVVVNGCLHVGIAGRSMFWDPPSACQQYYEQGDTVWLPPAEAQRLVKSDAVVVVKGPRALAKVR
ncbi:MAG: hypothetical protein ACLP19_26075 [Xanthobacteraceae bacterium]